jgi:manganese/iron transport system permease protein
VNGLVEWVMAPLAYPFMVRGLWAALLVGTVCAVVGTYVVLRGMAFLGDALSHSILPGVAVGYLLGGGARAPLFWWSLAAAIVAALGIGTVSRRAHLREDAAIGIIFAGMFALGIALISLSRTYAVDLAHFLFGDVLGVTAHDLWLTAGFGGAVLLLVVLFYKEFLILSFDPILATTLRLPVRTLYHLLLIMTAVAIVVSLQTVGVAMVIALLVTPPATAGLFTRRLPRMMALAAAIGSGSGVAGLYLSYYFGMASGAAIVLVCTGVFLLALAVHRRGART